MSFFVRIKGCINWRGRSGPCVECVTYDGQFLSNFAICMKFMQIAFCMKFMQIVFISMFFYEFLLGELANRDLHEFRANRDLQIDDDF